MRLFIAIVFHNKIKNYLLEEIQYLKEHSNSGNFTRPENLHLTLVFIGETKNSSAVINAMNKINMCCFDLTLGGMGTFKQSRGNIYWIDAKPKHTLLHLYNSLSEELKNMGFSIENRAYQPHVTIGKSVTAREPINMGMKKISMPVKKISLMKSDYINGTLTYTEIYAKGLVQ